MIPNSDAISGSQRSTLLEPGNSERSSWRALWLYRELFAILIWRDVTARLSKADVYKGNSRIIAVLPKVIQHCLEAVYLIVGDGDAKSDLEREVANRELASGRPVIGGRMGAPIILQKVSSGP